MWQLCLFTNSPVLHSGTTKAVKESWRQKLHLAKLAAWMKAKAQMEASDLASSLVPLMLPVKNTDDYDILPQGEDEKKTDDRLMKFQKQYVLLYHSFLSSGHIEDQNHIALYQEIFAKTKNTDQKPNQSPCQERMRERFISKI